MKAHIGNVVVISIILSLTATVVHADRPSHGFPGKGSVSQWNKAVSVYNKAVKLDRDHDYANASALYQQAIKMYPHDADFYTNLGLLYESRNEFQDADRMFQRAIQESPTDADYRLRYVGLLIDEKKFAEAAAALTKAEKYANTANYKMRVEKLKALLEHH